MWVRKDDWTLRRWRAKRLSSPYRGNLTGPSFSFSFFFFFWLVLLSLVSFVSPFGHSARSIGRVGM